MSLALFNASAEALIASNSAKRSGGMKAHTATSQDAAAPFDTGKLETGRAASYRFETPGTFAYKCAIHNSMTGTIVVK